VSFAGGKRVSTVNHTKGDIMFRTIGIAFLATLVFSSISYADVTFKELEDYPPAVMQRYIAERYASIGRERVIMNEPAPKMPESQRPGPGDTEYYPYSPGLSIGALKDKYKNWTRTPEGEWNPPGWPVEPKPVSKVVPHICTHWTPEMDSSQMNTIVKEFLAKYPKLRHHYVNEIITGIVTCAFD
jgi:hypothetical protein